MNRNPKTYAPCEKQVEMLFNHHFLLSFPKGTVALFAPSSREECKLGYDASFTGFKGCFELRLQFKRPRLRKDYGFTIDLSPHQHIELQRWPQDSAYYVSANFRSLEELQSLLITPIEPADFLHHFLAVEVKNLSSTRAGIRYHKEGNVEASHWLYGDDLVDRFKQYQAGHLMKFSCNDEPNLLPVNEREIARREANFEALKQCTKMNASTEHCADVGVKLYNDSHYKQPSLFRLYQPL